MKEKIIFRQTELIDREKERKFIKEWFEQVPSELLWIYGPKSTGKTTIIEYIVENELFDDFKLFKSEKYNVKYINFRRKLFGNYDSFVNSLLFVDDNNDEISDFVIEYMTEKEFLFFDPLTNEITANNKVYFNAFKLLVNKK